MSDDAAVTTALPLDGLDIDKLLALRRERRRIDAEIAALLDPAGATTLPTWGPCTRCGHVWQGRSQRRPGHCAGCASAYWDREPRRSTAGKPGTPRAKRSRGTRKKAAASVTSMPSRTPLVSDADFIAAIRGALPPPPAMTPPPPFLVRPTPPPRYVPMVEEPQPESVASRAPTFDDVTQVTLDAAAEELRDVILPPDIDLTEAAPRDLTREYLEEADDAPTEPVAAVVEKDSAPLDPADE